MMLCCFFFYICCSCHHLIITSFVYIYVSPLLSETGKRKGKKSKNNATNTEDDDSDVTEHTSIGSSSHGADNGTVYESESGSGSDGDHMLQENEFVALSEEEEGDPELSNEEEEEDEVNTFKVREYIKNDQKEFPLVAYAVEGKISIGLLPLSFFVHQNENFLFCEYTDLLSLVIF